MEDEILFTVEYGFRIRRRVDALSVEQAASILSGRRQRRCTSALRTGERILLTRDTILCPHCGKETPAYSRYSRSHPRRLPEKIPAPQVRDWSTGYSMFPEDNVLVFNRVWSSRSFQCPRCGMISRNGAGAQEVSIRWDGKSILMTVPDRSSQDLQDSMEQAAAEGYRLCFPLWETVSFCLKTGRTVLTVTDSLEHPLKQRDVSFPNVHWRESCVFGTLSFSALARRKLSQFFAARWPVPLPYVHGELEPDRFLLMTRFRGYDRAFFDFLPIGTDGEFDRSFRSLAHRMRDAAFLPKLYTSFGLPEKKSIRRFFFANPSYFWYAREALVFWELLRDVNRFHAFLISRRSLEALVLLHRYPHADIFLRDYAAGKGCDGLLRLLEQSCDLGRIWSYASRYAMGSEAQKRRERARWQEPEHILHEPPGAFTLPMHLTRRDMKVDGYSFRWLRSVPEFREAGQELHNCLEDCGSDGMNVLVVRQEGHALAAVEVAGDQIVQALGPYNEELDQNGSLCRALAKWAGFMGFRLLPPEDEEPLYF